MGSETEPPSLVERMAFPGMLFVETGTWFDGDGVARSGAMPFLVDLKVGMSMSYAVRAKLIANGLGSYVGLTQAGRQAFNRVRKFRGENSK